MQLPNHVVVTISTDFPAALTNVALGPREVGGLWSIDCNHSEPNNVISLHIESGASHLATRPAYDDIQSPRTIAHTNWFTLYWGTVAMRVTNNHHFDKATIELHHIAGVLESITSMLRESSYKHQVDCLDKIIILQEYPCDCEKNVKRYPGTLHHWGL